MRRCLTQVVFAVAMMSPLPALAQNQPCPPGAWFCADAEVQVPAPSKQAPTPAAVDDEEEQPAPPPVKPPHRRPRAQRADLPPPPQGPQPPVVIYQPVAPTAPPPNIIIVTPGYRRYAPAPPPMPPRARPRARSEWGVNLRVEGMSFGSKNSAANAAMGGVGLGLRYRPVPAFAMELGVDVIAGNDYNGFERTEVPISLSGLLYLTPRSRVQLYLTGGMHFSRAQVRSADPSPLLQPLESGEYGETYTYFGGQGGLGLEFRVSRRVGINLEGLAFYRGRLNAEGRAPEFVDPEDPSRTTNRSAGGMARAGITLYW